jgi:hypothetical protein
MPKFARRMICIVVLLATWTVVAGVVVGQFGQGNLELVSQRFTVLAVRFPRAAHHIRPADDWGPARFSSQLLPIDVLPFLLTFILVTLPGTHRDLLQLTQRRRE